ncbi:glycosyltransferase involved in cell wall biosynthesis [Mycolicibacterium sp. BK634]|uniref:glycosyltransferase family 4 protein n=1 Tax=Mycobacteriaceae TaxID=1762 RepID=UPI001802F7DF|nr:glycosyltransferase family 4 protein [Mycobacterium sp. BK086]MBB3747979.1 glycosyltransferase involved in cell wall biosynthesis [Mycolicibacterium sp. BK634]
MTTSSRPGGDGSPSLRFAFFTELCLPSIGGQEIFFLELGETLVRRGHAVDIYCIGHEPGLSANETINGVQVHRNPNGGHYKNPRIKALRRDWSDIAKYSAGIRKVAKSGRHDFYLLNQWPLMHVAALPNRVRKRSGLHWCEIREDPLLRALQATLPRTVSSSFAISASVAQGILDASGRPTLVLPSGIQLERYRSKPRSERSGVLAVGRVAPHKNLELLIDAFGLAAARGLTGDLTIGGDGPARSDVEAYARQSPVADRIHVLGSVTEEKKIELLSQASILGMPSKREGFPRVITEAMASGLPVVTGRFPENGSTAIVSQYSSGIVCGTEPAEFADALLAVEAEWDGYSRAGLAAAQTLDWSDIARTLEERVREVIAH